MEVYRVEDKDVYEVIDELIKNELENNINISEDEIFNKEADDRHLYRASGLYGRGPSGDQHDIPGTLLYSEQGEKLPGNVRDAEPGGSGSVVFR